MATEFMRRHILRLPPTQIFTTREMLPYGSRSAIDQALAKMVNDCFIIRLARGVFVRDLANNPTKYDIAIAKLEAFGKRLIKYGEKILMELNLISFHEGINSVFAVNAHSSSFGTILGRVYFKGIGPRKVRLCKTAVGRVVYALWHLGSHRCQHHHVAISTKTFGRSDREEFRLTSKLMPAWLNQLCRFRFPEPTVPAAVPRESPNQI